MIAPESKIAPGKPLIFQVSEQKKHDLIFILKLVQDDSDDNQDQSSEDEQEQDQDQQQDDTEDQQNQEQNPEEQNQEGNGEGEDEPKPQDLSDVNIDALLQSLAEMDKREQEEAKNMRETIEIRKSWW